MYINQALKQGITANVRRLIDVVSSFRSVAMAASVAYCAVHLLVAHRFSAIVFVGALVFGTVAAVGAAWMSGRRFPAPST